ncbi:DUF418 domain-containing protein [Cytobacillus depressus]|uniref:DUF418 domain-containing protein n=1 Tax=Cytobacillus depressus TaxID=1602942 RepID=A0A6L3VCX1_9BACI|nr:DUF418 domain-containing protein [Cytobacillus depressus]KAB2337171.1 DUF418 domain-containing protein [Cytobacillus depressus]
MNQHLSPVSERERILSLDMIRGFAILGIFLVNMLSFHSPFPFIDPYEWWKGPVNHTVYRFIDIFVQASFYTLFSLLFGYSLVIFREKAILKGQHFGKMAVRRLTLLLVIGIVHAFLIWHGDILITYALMGFLFLLFIRMNGKNLILTGFLLYAIPNILLIFLLIIAVLFSPEGDLALIDPKIAEAALQAYQNGSFSEIMVQRFREWSFANNLETLPIMIVSIFPLFLIGGGAAKLKWLENVEKHTKLLRNLLIISLLTGMFFKLTPYIFGGNPATDYIQDIFGGPLLAIGFAMSIALLAHKQKVKKLLYPLSYVGRLSMSNYLFQSTISTLIFYHYGLGLYGKVSVLTGTIMVIVIYIFQVIISRYWLRHYYYGPVEWLWRSFTYFRLPKMKRS